MRRPGAGLLQPRYEFIRNSLFAAVRNHYRSHRRKRRPSESGEVLATRMGVPYQSSNLVEVLGMHAMRPMPDMQALNREIPGWFQEFVESCLEKIPGHRYQTISEAAVILFEKALDAGLDLKPYFPEFVLTRLTPAKRRWFSKIL